MSINITLFIQGLAFFAVAWVVMKFLWPPMLGAIEERQKKIADGLAAAEEGKRALASASEKQDQVIREARGEAQGIRERAEKEYASILDKARTDAVAEGNRVKAAAIAEIQTATHRAREELRHQVADLAVKGAERLMRKEVDARTHKVLLDELIGELAR